MSLHRQFKLYDKQLSNSWKWNLYLGSQGFCGILTHFFFFFVRFILISFSFPDYFKWNDLMQAANAQNGTSAVGLNTDHRPVDAAAVVVVVLLLHFNFNFNRVKWRVLSEWAQLRLDNELLSLQMNCNSSNILFFSIDKLGIEGSISSGLIFFCIK